MKNVKTVPVLSDAVAQKALDIITNTHLSLEDLDIIKKRISRQKSAFKIAIAKTFKVGDSVEYIADYGNLKYGSLKMVTIKGVVVAKNKGMSVPIIILDIIEEYKDGTTKSHSGGDVVTATYRKVNSQYSFKGTSLIKI